ncbi:cytochrome c oxidase subunit NDUFA4-like [Pecten maximus]|uniref:cytochrome c oxidase subunit NDUFA4-like n=1 Tax=Pecten maximus TaxID=6579 RepID=UPI00145871BB|nr:cytochrome c oxidase subunit NDUFA4-like [Pecten maximus]
MVHLTKLLRHGGPTPYHTNPRLMVGSGKEVLNTKSHYSSLLPIHLVTLGGCVVCAWYMCRSLFFSPDVMLKKDSRSYPWLMKSNQHQYKLFSFSLKYKDLKNHPNHPEGFHGRVQLSSKDYFKLSSHGHGEGEAEH